MAIIYFVYSVHDIYLHTNPDIRFYETYTNEPPLLNFGTENKFIAVGLNTLDGAMIMDPSLFEIQINLINKNQLIKSFDLEVCNRTNKAQDFQNFIDQIQNPQSFYCLKDYSALQFQGTVGSQEFKFVDLWIKPCNQNEGGVLCKNSSQLDEILKKSSFVLKYGTISLEPFDYETPLKQIVAEYFAPLNNLNLPEIFINFAQLHVQDKNKMSSMDIFQAQENSRNGILFSSEKYSVKPRNSTEPIFHLNLRLEKTQKTVLRIYETWIDVLSKVGGFVSFLNLALNLILTRFVRAALIQRLSNDVLDKKEMIKDLDPDNPLKKLDSTKAIKMSFWTYIKTLCRCIHLSRKKRKKASHLVEIVGSTIFQMMDSLDISRILGRLYEAENAVRLLPGKQVEMVESQSKPPVKYSPKKMLRNYTEDIDNTQRNSKNYSNNLTPNNVNRDLNLEMVNSKNKHTTRKSMTLPALDEIDELKEENINKLKTIKERDFFFPDNKDYSEIEKKADIAVEDVQEDSGKEFLRKEKIVNEFFINKVHFQYLDKF